VNEGASEGLGGVEGWDGLWHYYHFAAEDMLGGLVALGTDAASETKCSLPERVMIPWGGYKGYEDVWGMNVMVINGVFSGSKSTSRRLPTDHR